MVQVFSPTPAPSQGGMLGQSLGSALGGFAGQKMLGMRQQSALEDFQNMLDQQNDKPADVAMKWAKSMAGVPGSSQLAQTLLPQFMMQSTMNLFNQPNQPGGNVANQQPGEVPQGNIQGAGGMGGIMPPTPGMNAPQGGMGGIMPSSPVMNAPQGGMMQRGGAQPTAGLQPQGQGLNPQAMQLSQLTGRPYNEILSAYAGVPQEQIASEIQKQQLARNTELSNFASSKNENLVGDDLNDFMRIGQKYQNLSPQEWYRATEKDWKLFNNEKTAFSRANIPGMVSGLLRGGKYREDQMKRLNNLAKPLVDLGYDDIVRSELTKNGLSPTEIEMVIKPFSNEVVSKMGKLPSAPYKEEDFFGDMFAAPMKPTYDDMLEKNPKLMQKITNDYTEFLQENVSPDKSLLAMRDYLYRNKNLDWRQFYDSLNNAVDNGLQLSPEQQNEYAELTRAPRDSLAWIFQDMGNLWDYLKGAK